MISTGNNDLDREMGSYGNELVMIYGPSGSGKTTMALIASIGQHQEKKKTVFVDTENKFPVKRLQELSNRPDIFDSILLIKVKDYKEQTQVIKGLAILVKNSNTSLVVVDTIGNHYRLMLQENYSYANRVMSLQLSLLSQIAREYGVTVLLTNQVYAQDENICAVGGKMMLNWSRKVIELKKNPVREMIVKKPLLKSIGFRINSSGIEILK